MSRDYMTAAEVRDLLEISSPTMTRYHQSGRLTAHRIGNGPSGALVFRRDEVAALALARFTSKPDDEPEPIDPAAGYGEGTRHGARLLEDIDDRDTVDKILGREPPKVKATVSADVVNRAKARKDWPKW